MKYILSLLVVLLSGIRGSAQTNFNELLLKIDKDLQMLSDKYPQERVALFTDKQSYYSRENILFSTFLLLEGKASPLSKTLYVEVGDYAGNVLEKRMLAVTKGTGHGLIPVSPDWPSGAYVINAYTLWMKNMPQLIAQTQVFITGKDYLEKPFVYRKEDAPVAKARLLPEGGSWGAGVTQNVLLQLTDANQFPLQRTFVLLENGKELIKGETSPAGFAKLEMSPNVGAAYVLKTGAQQLALSLPANEGLALSFNTENKSRVFVNLQKSATHAGNQFLLVGYNEEKVCFQSVFDFKEGATGAAIVRSKLPRGVLHFLLFDEKGTIVAQRDVYNSAAFPTINEQSAANNRKLVTIDNLQNGFVAAAIKEEKAPTTGFNLVTLLPELQHNYTVALTDFSPASLQTIDALLWSQPAPMIGKNWIASEPQLKFPVELGIALRGTIKPYAGAANPAGYKAELMIKGEDSTTAFSSVQTTPAGEFIIPDLSFQQGAKVFFQGNNKENGREILNMQLLPAHIDSLSKVTLPPVVRLEKHFLNAPSDDVRNYFAALDNDPRYKQLDAVVLKTKKRSPLDSLKALYVPPLFDDGNATLLEPKGNYINIWHFLRGSVPGLRVDGSMDNPSVSFSRYGGSLNSNNSGGEDLSEGFGEQSGVLFFLNEVQVSKDVVTTINPEDVAVVAVNRQPMATLGAYNGAIAIFTKKGVSTSGNIGKSMSFMQRKGYTPFISPYRVEGNEARPGATVLFSTANAPYKTTLPASHSYRYAVAGWNADNELVIGVNQ